MKKFTPLLATLVLLLAQAGARADLNGDIRQLQTRWAQVNYELKDKAQLEAYEQLITAAENVTRQYPQAAEGWIWSGIIKSSYAGAKGGLGALKYAKASRRELENALQLNDRALAGSAYTSLGTLYFKVPGWPIGFGDDDKAEQLLKKALAINPAGIDSNYFYGEYLREQGNYRQAETFLLKAQQAAPRPDRPLADKGRQQEISLALQTVRHKLKH